MSVNECADVQVLSLFHVEEWKFLVFNVTSHIFPVFNVTSHILRKFAHLVCLMGAVLKTSEHLVMQILSLAKLLDFKPPHC